MESDEPPAETVRFKSKKRSRTIRQRDASPPAQATAPAPDAATTPDDANNGEDVDSTVQAALKLRQARSKNRFRRGVGFGRDEAAGSGDVAENSETGLVLRDAASAASQGLPDRFMHQTGFVADADDKHMMAYVESRLSTRASAGDTGAEQQSLPEAKKSTSQQQQQQQQQEPRRQGTMQTGTSTTSWTKLVEVQVPEDVLRKDGKNKKRGAEETATKPPPSSRRRRNRRGSDDVKRDQMVEAFLHENRLDVYDVPAATSSSSAADPSRSADDVLAENFRQQYMDEMAARRQRKRPAINQPRLSQKQQAHQQAVAAGEVLKGPKLGGSRNARAAVRDALLQQQELSKKTN